jgi:hypothetical protein
MAGHPVTGVEEPAAGFWGYLLRMRGGVDEEPSQNRALRSRRDGVKESVIIACSHRGKPSSRDTGYLPALPTYSGLALKVLSVKG